MYFAAVINQDAGSLKAVDQDCFKQHIVQEFTEAGHEIDVYFVSKTEIVSTLENVAKDKVSDAILVAGGDGSASLAAKLCYENSKTFSLIPAGTMNLFARTLGLPMDPYEAVTAIANGKVSKCDLASVNGQAYIHQFSIGMQPQLIEKREEGNYESKTTKVISSLGATISVLTDEETYKFEMTVNDSSRHYEVSLITVSNNPYGKDHLPYADHLNKHNLGVYWAEPLSGVEKASLVIDILSGNWNTNENLKNSITDTLVLKFDHHVEGIQASLDGELIPLERELIFKSIPAALNIIKANN